LLTGYWITESEQNKRTVISQREETGIAKHERSHTSGQRVSLATTTDGGARISSVPGAHHVRELTVGFILLRIA